VAARVPARLSPSEGRRFAFPVGCAFGILAVVLWWRGHPREAWTLGAVAAALLLAGAAVPSRLGPVQRAWMAGALALSRITTPIVMAIVYYLVLSPTGLIMRLLGRNPLVHANRNGSYWVRRPEGEGRVSNLERQF